MKPFVAMSRRKFADRLLGVALGAATASVSSSVGAQQGKSRLNPDERERLREALRERGASSAPAREPGPGRSEPGRGDPAPGRGSHGSERERLSDDERAQLRRQLREAGRRPD